MYHPTTRVLKTLELLQIHGTMSGSELARRLEIDPRTTRRYIDRLRELGIPVEAEPGRAGGYRLRPGYKLPPLMFSEDEAVALTLSLRIAHLQGIATDLPAVDVTLGKITRVLPEQARERVQALERAIAYSPRSRRDPAPGGVAATVSLAIQREQRLLLQYRDSQGEETERLFDPFGIVSRQDYWYVIGYCHLRQAQRTFRLDRILTAALQKERFVRPASFSVEDALEDALAAIPRRWSVVAQLDTPLEEARLRAWPAMADVEQMDGKVVMRCTTDNLPWMARFLASMGIPFRIAEPPELRAALRDYALALLEVARDARDEAEE